MPFIEHVTDWDLERLSLEWIVPALQCQGYCYLDGLLGEPAGDAILEQVKDIHSAGALQDGRLAGSVPVIPDRNIRGDQICWVSGAERGCEAISFLLNLIDKLINLCAERLGKRTIRDRSKVREYPGISVLVSAHAGP